jgi:putative flippase GtrA
MKLKLTKKLKKELWRIFEYGVSGGAFFWSGYLAFFVFDHLLGASLWWSTSVSYLIGWTVNYLLQRYWVFSDAKLAGQQLEVTGRYIIISLVNLLINYVIIKSLKQSGITPYIGQFVSAGFFTVWNYLWYKFWVFTKAHKQRRK